jgi:hypothetical protein
VQGALPFCVAVPVIAMVTVALSPGSVPQVPPTAVTFAFVECGKVRGVPFTVVIATAGAPVSMMIVCAPVVPVLPPASVCETVTE